MKFYNLSIDKLITELDTDLKNGLSHHQAQERLKKDGRNFHVYNSVIYYKSRLIRVLFFVCLAALVYIALSLFKRDMDYLLYGIAALLLPVMFSVAFFYYSSYIKKRLSAVTPFDYALLDVVRDGKISRVHYADITYGDVVLLKKGDYIPFDARIIESDSFVTDETSVTCENNVKKRADVITDENIDVSRLHNMVFCSSYVVKGSARVIVTDISKRVLVRRKVTDRGKKTRIAVKISDFFRILSLLLLALSIAFSLIVAVLLSDYMSFVVSSLLLAAAFTCDFLASYIDIVSGKCYYKLYKQGVFVKNTSVFDRLNSSNILLLRHSSLFDKSSEISGFVTEKDEYKQLSEINKSNFSVFLYSSFCNDSAGKDSPYYSFKKLTLKILKGVGIDYSDIKSMCPVISQYSDINSDFDICGIVYDGSNVLIARGDYSSVLKLCGQDYASKHREAIDRLSRNSTEIIAVAVKQVDIISDDLSEETDGFKLAGFIGLKRNFSKSKVRMLNSLEKSGIHSVLLFSGNETLARAFRYKDVAAYSEYKDLFKPEREFSISKCDVIYNFDGDMERVCDLCISEGLMPIYIGSKNAEEKKAVAFNSCKTDMYSARYNDVISDSDIGALYNSIISVKSALSAVRDMLVNTIVFSMLYIICGVLFALLNRQTLFSPQILSAVVFCGIPLSALFTSSCIRKSGLESTAAFLNEPLQKKSMIFAAMSCVLFILMTVVLRFVLSAQTASGFIAVAFLSFIVPVVFEINLHGKSAVMSLVLGFLPAVILSVVLMTPVSGIFYVDSFTALHALLALILGVLIKYLSTFISRSVNF